MKTAKNQKCQMDSIVRYWDRSEQRVKVRYWQSSYLGCSLHTNLLEHFNKSIETLDPSKMIQVSLDRPSVNLKFYKELTNKRSDSGIPALIEFGSCSLHIVNGAFQRGAEQSGWNLKKTLKSVWQLFHDSPARRDDYETLSDSTTFPMAFCATRWVESMIVANRAILIWSNIVKTISFWEKQPRSNQPKCQSCENFKVTFNDNLTTAKLELFAYIASILEPFFKGLPINHPMLPFLYFNLKSLLATLLELFIKPSVIAAAKTGSSLINIDISKTSNQIPNKDLDLGFATEAKLKKLRLKDLVSIS